VRIVAAAEIKVAHVKLDEGTRQSARGLRVTCDGIMNLIAVVAATCPRMLNQPVIQAAKGAPRGLEIMAAQKYGPPLVGYALQISETAHHKRARFRKQAEDVPAILKPTNIVKKPFRQVVND